MNEILLSIKSQLVYVVENQYKLKSENFLKKYHTPDLDIDLLNDYLNIISNDIVESLEINYNEILEKALYIQRKFPDVEELNQQEKEILAQKTITFINEELSQIIFNKVSSNILE